MSETQSPTTPTADEILASAEGYDGFVRSLFNRSGDPSKDFTHAILGILTECHEYLNATDEVNALEEAGDLLFYVCALKQVLVDAYPSMAADVEALQASDLHVILEELDAVEWAPTALIDQGTLLMDIAKRWVGYGKAPEAATVALLLARCTCLAGYITESGPLKEEDFDRAVKANVEKLLTRYNGVKFDAARAVTRNLGEERGALERAA